MAEETVRVIFEHVGAGGSGGGGGGGSSVGGDGKDAGGAKKKPSGPKSVTLIGGRYAGIASQAMGGGLAAAGPMVALIAIAEILKTGLAPLVKFAGAILKLLGVTLLPLSMIAIALLRPVLMFLLPLVKFMLQLWRPHMIALAAQAKKLKTGQISLTDYAMSVVGEFVGFLGDMLGPLFGAIGEVIVDAIKSLFGAGENFITYLLTNLGLGGGITFATDILKALGLGGVVTFVDDLLVALIGKENVDFAGKMIKAMSLGNLYQMMLDALGFGKKKEPKTQLGAKPPIPIANVNPQGSLKQTRTDIGLNMSAVGIPGVNMTGIPGVNMTGIPDVQSNFGNWAKSTMPGSENYGKTATAEEALKMGNDAAKFTESFNNLTTSSKSLWIQLGSSSTDGLTGSVTTLKTNIGTETGGLNKNIIMMSTNSSLTNTALTKFVAALDAASVAAGAAAQRFSNANPSNQNMSYYYTNLTGGSISGRGMGT